ncbi:MAG: cation:proton antiporter [Candidatus Melainabacteria bacterium]|nr:cation:proton antiporter [Candidatus Melainabacteria bacterium]
MEIWLLGAFWFFLALLADFVAIRLKIAVALSEIIIGLAAAYLISLWLPQYANFGSDIPWVQFLAGIGAVLLTFLAGAELDPSSLKGQMTSILLIGITGFVVPFLGCSAIAYYLLHWSLPASLLTGVALSTTSVAVVYAVMLELGFNKTRFGKAVLAACFVNDLGTVLALGFIFSPFNAKSIIFLVAAAVIFTILPRLTRFTFKRWGNRASEQEVKYLFFFLFGLGYLAFWSGSEPVLPAYVMGMIVASIMEKDHQLVKRLRAITFGLLTPFYFLRAGAFVSIPALVHAPLIFLILFFAKMVTKSLGVYPAAKLSRYPEKDAIYTTLLMSTGLTFGTIASLYGLTHHLIDQNQYSLIVITVIASAIIPTLIANAFFLPKHHIVKASSAIDPELPPKRK